MPEYNFFEELQKIANGEEVDLTKPPKFDKCPLCKGMGFYKNEICECIKKKTNDN